MSKNRAQRRAEARRGGGSADGGKSNRIVIILGVVLLVGAASLGYSLLTGMGAGVTEPVEVEGLEDPERLVEVAQGIEVGNPDAPVTLVEFADYQCPACQQFATQVLPSVKRELVDEGRVRYVFYDFPLVAMHPNAFYAARAARCAGDQDRYWDYHDHLFLQQSEWSASGNPTRLFSGYADELGMDRSAFDSCLRSDRHAEVVTANRVLGERMGVSGTPTVMVSSGQGGAVRVSDWTFNNIVAAVEAELEG